MSDSPQNLARNNPDGLLTAKQAASVAAKYLADLIGLTTKPMIEEIELNDDSSSWLITLSYLAPDNDMGYHFGNTREFKTFEIKRLTGEVISMKIRSVK